MRSKEDFINIVDAKFFNHLQKRTMLPFDVEEDRKSYLEKTYQELLNSFTDYRPNEPRKYISFPKSKYVIRMVPTFELDDYLIYYYCVKSLENKIAVNRTPNTFGGFQLGGKLREEEDLEFEPTYEDSFNENSFNPYAWKVEYNAYQARLRELAHKMTDEFQFAVQFDIANFYDCIRIDLLRKKLDEYAGEEENSDERFLLIRFLKYWNNRFDNEKNVGIPQDEVGDCSRILANFFLQDYDAFLYEECMKKNAVYLRFADDQIIFAKSKRDAEDLLYMASHKLFEEGLNINTGKTKEYKNYQEFNTYFAFSIFEELAFETQNINRALDLFIQNKEEGIEFRDASVLRRLLHNKIRHHEIENQKRIKLLGYLWSDDFLLFASDHYMKQIHNLLNTESEKQEFLDNLESISNQTNFESFKINHQKFLENVDPPIPF